MSNIVIPKSNAQDRASQEFANDILSCKDFKSKGCVVKIHGLGKTLMEDCLSYHFEYNNGEYKTESKPIDFKTYVEVINEFRKSGYTVSVLSKNYSYLTLLIKG